MCSKMRARLSGILPGQLHPFGRLAATAMRRLTGASDAWICLPGKGEAQMATERRAMPVYRYGYLTVSQGTKQMFFQVQWSVKSCNAPVANDYTDGIACLQQQQQQQANGMFKVEFCNCSAAILSFHFTTAT